MGYKLAQYWVNMAFIGMKYCHNAGMFGVLSILTSDTYTQSKSNKTINRVSIENIFIFYGAIAQYMFINRISPAFINLKFETGKKKKNSNYP